MKLPFSAGMSTFAASLAVCLVLPASGPASATEFVCDGVDGEHTRLGVPEHTIVVISRAHDGGRCGLSVAGYPAGGSSLWALDNMFEEFRRSRDTGEGLVYSALLRSHGDAPPHDLATLLLSAGGYGDSTDRVSHGVVVEFADRFLDDRDTCLYMIEGSGGFEPLEFGFCGYLRIDDDLSDSDVANALAEAGISIALQFYEGNSTFEHSYFVYGIDTGHSQIAAFFPTER